MNRLCEMLGIRYPIIQAPMAGGSTTPDLVAAVGNAGALGSFGFASSSPQTIRGDMERVRQLTTAPVNANLFIYPPMPSPSDDAIVRAVDALRPWFRRLGIEPPAEIAAPWAPDFAQQVDALLALRPDVLTVHLAAPDADLVRRFQAVGSRVGGSATTPLEAVALIDAGVDFIIAQGAEAGGHRGTFLDDAESGMIGTLALTRLLVVEGRRAGVPVIAAGGIMDGAGMAAALALGAEGVQLGTAFLACRESGASPVHKSALAAAREAGTRVTVHFSGKPARTVSNPFAIETGRDQPPYLPFPAQNKVTGSLRAASARAGSGDCMSLWAGQAASLARPLAAGELVERLVAEYGEARAGLPVMHGNRE